MPKARASNPRSRARPAFTLVEVLIASGIGLVIMAAIMNAYFAADKAQAIAVGTGVLKASGQKTLNEVYALLHQNRHLFDRNATTTTWLGRLPIRPWDSAGLSPGLPSPNPSVDLRLPLVKPNGTFLSQEIDGDTPAGWDASIIGNALFFATLEPQVRITEASPAVIHTAAFGGSTFLMNTTRLHFYFLARKTLGLNAPPVRGTQDYVYYLMHWESERYVDYGDMVKYLNAVKDTNLAGTDTLIDAKLAALKDTTKSVHFAGALDLGVADASTSSTTPAIYNLTATSDKRNLTVNSGRLETHRFGSAVDFSMKSAFGEPMIAFNTTGATPVPVPSLDVPAYADDSATYPYGFEVMVVGPPEARRALIRLVLATRAKTGKKTFFGQTFQQVVQLYEYTGK